MPTAAKLRAMRGPILPLAAIVRGPGLRYDSILPVTEAAGGVGAALTALGWLSWTMIQAALRRTMITVGTIWLIRASLTLLAILGSVWPFISLQIGGLQIGGLLLVMLFPQIALWLPGVVFG